MLKQQDENATIDLNFGVWMIKKVQGEIFRTNVNDSHRVNSFIAIDSENLHGNCVWLALGAFLVLGSRDHVGRRSRDSRHCA